MNPKDGKLFAEEVKKLYLKFEGNPAAVGFIKYIDQGVSYPVEIVGYIVRLCSNPTIAPALAYVSAFILEYCPSIIIFYGQQDCCVAFGLRPNGTWSLALKELEHALNQ